MVRSLSMLTVSIVLVLRPMPLTAGGPAQLCLPIAGVTEENLAACSQRLATALGDRLSLHVSRTGVKLEHHRGQWYTLLSLAESSDVKLSDIDAALEGSEFSVPRDGLRFFGPVRLDVHVAATGHQALLTDLAAIKHVQIDEASHRGGKLRVTLVLPDNGRQNIFELLNDSPPASNGSAVSITVLSLPSYPALCDFLARHDARLSDVGWSGTWACRMLGTLAVAPEDAKPDKVVVTR